MLAWFLSVLLLPAWADALSFEAVRVVEHGKDVPKVVFKLGESGRISAIATCGGRTWRLDSKGSAGSDLVLALDGIAAGRHRCEIDVEFVQDNGAEGGTRLQLDVAALPPLELSTTFDEVDIDHDQAVIHGSRDLVEARVTVFGARGAQLDQVMGERVDRDTVKFTWDGHGQSEVKLLVEARDEDGLWANLELLPWRLDIPHEDVVFETGSDVIRDSEVPKLHHAWEQVVEAIELYGSVVEVRLYIAGYTDTVGDAASNLTLSRGRAKSIARWFRQAGFRGPIAYQGFGESVLAVGTPDNTDEAANRRALYVLAAQPPPPGGAFPRSDWSPL